MKRLFIFAISLLIQPSAHAAFSGHSHWILFGHFKVQPEHCEAVAAKVYEFIRSDQELYKNITFNEKVSHYSKCNNSSEVEYFLNARALYREGMIELDQYLDRRKDVVVQGHTMRFAQVLSYGVHTKVVFYSHNKTTGFFIPLHKAALWEVFPTLETIEQMANQRIKIAQALQWVEFEKLSLPLFGADEIGEFKRVISKTVMVQIEHDIHYLYTLPMKSGAYNSKWSYGLQRNCKDEGKCFEPTNSP